MKRLAQLVVLFLLVSPLLAQQASQPPFDAKNFPLRDSHQGVTIAADPYLTEARAKTVFGDHAPNRAGILPLEVILTNDTDAPIGIEIDRCQLIISRSKKLDPLSIDRILAHLYRPEIETGGPRPRSPIPKIGKKSRARKNVEAAEADFRSKLFRVDRIAPHGSARGFLFFEVGKPLELPPGAVLYVPEVENEQTGEPLLYFEVPLAAAPGRPPNAP